MDPNLNIKPTQADLLFEFDFAWCHGSVGCRPYGYHR